jgi:polyisoprenoid-binding protein YceI
MTDVAQGASTYNLDPAHSSVQFSVRHLAISHVRGEFTGVSGTLTVDPADPTSSKVDVTIDVDSISTRIPDRDAHLKSAEFFDAATFPTITFVSTSAIKTSDDEGTVTGDLTIHGVTKSETLAVEGSLTPINDQWGNLRLGFTAKTKIKRSEFGLTYNAALETGGVLISDSVDLTIDAQFVRPA